MFRILFGAASLVTVCRPDDLFRRSLTAAQLAAPDRMSLHGKRKEIYKYEAPWTVYAMNWSVRPDKRFRLALGSFVEEYNNKVKAAVQRRSYG